MSSFPASFSTLDSAAKRLLTTPEKLQAELESGRLEGFRLGDEWRTTEAALLKFMGIFPSDTQERTPTMTTTMTATTPQSDDFASILADAEWKPVDPFDYQWATEKGKERRPEHSWKRLTRRG